MARGKTLLFVKPVLTTVQFVPLFVDKRTPRLDEANSFELPEPLGETASENIISFLLPVLSAVQRVLLSVASRTPQKPPTKRSVSHSASERQKSPEV